MFEGTKLILTEKKFVSFFGTICPCCTAPITPRAGNQILWVGRETRKMRVYTTRELDEWGGGKQGYF